MKWEELQERLMNSKYYYFHTENGVLLCGDCIEVMKEIPNGCADLILTDPPYQISKKHNFHTMGRTGCYFGSWDTLDPAIWENLSLKAGKDSSVISFMSFEQYSDFVNIMKECDFIVKDRLIWEKTNPFPRNRDRRYIPNIELIVWCVKAGARWTFNRQNERYEGCVLKCPTVTGRRYHTTQKPIKLIEQLTKIHSNCDDIIFDPFLGSGTTAVVCENLNRKWIAIEIQEEFCEIAKERILGRDKLQRTLVEY